ncbi:MAG: hypothetical protein JSU94_19960 [Phycisphaerales bacterium]|nr:MAG: hypothetical protein JSU94_19960 [Phycisphaerales bacterium]
MKKDKQNQSEKPQKKDTPPEPGSESLQNRRRFLRSVGHTTAAVAGISFVGGLFPRQALGCSSCTDDFCSGTHECTGGTNVCSSNNTCNPMNKCSATTFTCSDGNYCESSLECSGTFFNCSGGNECGSTNTCSANFTCEGNNHSCCAADACVLEFTY